MLIANQINRTKLSSLLITLFFFLTLIGALFSEFFQTPNQENTEITKYRKLLDSHELEFTKIFKLKNGLGEFELVRSLDSRSWTMTSPRNLLANRERIDRILNDLSKLKIRYVYQKDKINLSNFSLDNPLFQVSINNSENQVVDISFGLINPIDRSTYAMLSTNNVIYHIDSINLPLSSLNLTDLIDTRVFPFQFNTLKNITVFRGKKTSTQLKIKKVDKDWESRNKHILSSEKIQAYFKSLSEFKSFLILDQISEEQKEKIDKYLETPMYTVEFLDNSNTTKSYLVSSPIPSLPEINVKKWQYVLVTPMDKSQAFVINKSILKKFSLTESKLKRISIKKLFY